MKLCNIKTDQGIHLALVTERGIIDATAAGFGLSMDQVIAGADASKLAEIAADASLPAVEAPVYANVVGKTGNLICVGLNYKEHAMKSANMLPEYPVLFAKLAQALVPDNSEVALPPWEKTYDYEAELVIVIGKEAWGVSEEDAMDYIFGYTCGNDVSCRASQKRTSQWLPGKSMPGFGPCGPWIVTKDSFDPNDDHMIRSIVNGEVRQNAVTSDMIFSCAKIVSYASKYLRLEPGDLIYTGTPSGVAGEGRFPFLVPGDLVEVEIEGIGKLTTRMVQG